MTNINEQEDNLLTGLICQGETTLKILTMIKKSVQQSGSSYTGAFGKVLSVKALTAIINNPFCEEENYPFWTREQDEWYQDNFVKKETNLPPEETNENQELIFPYKYVWRSRYYDSGLGYVMGVIKTFQKLGYKKIDFTNKTDFTDFLQRASSLFHPQSICAVLNWKGLKLLNFYIDHPEILEQELQTCRRDTLFSVINEIKNAPSSRRAITPSFIYEQIDHDKFSTGFVPVYQNYQLYTTINKQGKPDGLISLHLHRAIDVDGGFQLDISHDRAWGKIAQNELQLPLKKIIIFVNDVWQTLDEEIQKIETKKNIINWLSLVTDNYQPQKCKIEKYQKLIDKTWGNIKK